MKAAFITAHGGNEEIVRVRAHHLPDAHLAKCACACARHLNQVDLYMRNSGAGITHRLPQIMGLDGAGYDRACDASDPCCTPAGRWSSTRHRLRSLRVLPAWRQRLARIQFLGEHRDGTFAMGPSSGGASISCSPSELDRSRSPGVNHHRSAHAVHKGAPAYRGRRYLDIRHRRRRVVGGTAARPWP